METHLEKLILGAHILRLLAAAQRDERTLGLEELVEELGVRRSDVRGCLSSLHEEGYLDVTRMRLTLPGFAFGSALRTRRLGALRRPSIVHSSAA